MGALLFVDAIVRYYRSAEDAGATFKRLRQECLRLALADWSRVPILFELPVPAAGFGVFWTASSCRIVKAGEAGSVFGRPVGWTVRFV